MSEQTQQTQTEQKKKKSKKRKMLITDFNNLNNDEIIKTITEIRVKLKQIFKFHIGENESINPTDLFIKVFDIKPEDLNIYKRGFWYEILKKVIKQLRTENELFIIMNKSKIYVLQNEKELNGYKKVINRGISNFSKAKEKAEIWVNSEKWRDF